MKKGAHPRLRIGGAERIGHRTPCYIEGVAVAQLLATCERRSSTHWSGYAGGAQTTMKTNPFSPART